MTDIEQKARDMVLKEEGGYLNYDAVFAALCRVIHIHEAFKQEVSQTASSALVMYNRVGEGDCMTAQALQSLIIPAPKPDPLVEVMKDLGWEADVIVIYANDLRAALEARGLEIRSKSDD